MRPERTASWRERWWILARPDFRAAAARRLSEERELSPAIVSLLTSESPTRSVGVRVVPIDRIDPNPQQPRLVFNQETLDELAASIREHGVLQPILVRPIGANRFQLIAGERRWRASTLAGLETIPALIEDIDDDTALEISIIENLQREDISPLDEASMFDRMVSDHGYSIRKLADKLGKDKGYVENRLRLADAPDEVRALVSVRKDTLSHAYELMKVEDPKKRKRLAAQVASGELSLVKLRDKIEGRRPRPDKPVDGHLEMADDDASEDVTDVADDAGHPVNDDPPWAGSASRQQVALGDDSLINAKASLADALDDLVGVLRSPDAVASIPDVDRANLAKYLTIAKLKLENAIAIVRTGDTGD
jgi:ParB family transcriptional regulator, chromosome partitioning protein